MPKVSAIHAFTDNYIWLLENADGTALVVDPGDASPVIETLESRELELTGILLTHHHFDHVGGVEALKNRFACHVWGPDNPNVGSIDTVLRDGDTLVVGDFQFAIFAVPGHTLDHIAYYQDSDAPLLFCGDTLFAGGCGRIFEGDPVMMHHSLSRLAALPPATAVYCAHEYTLANLAFALAADPSNTALVERESDAQALRRLDTPTVPSTIGLELATNPFLRAANDELRQGLERAGRSAGPAEVDVFAELRAWKDNF